MKCKEIRKFAALLFEAMLLCVFFLLMFLGVAFALQKIGNVSFVSSENQKPSVMMSLLSGFIGSFLGAVISAVVVWKQLNDSTDTIKLQNQLKLRDMFYKNRRWKIHSVIEEIKILRQKDLSSEKVLQARERCKLISEEIKDDDSENDMLEKLDTLLRTEERALDDYLGLFDVAYSMLKKKLLDKDMFFQSYSYRLENLEKVDFVREKVFSTEFKYWKLLRKLLTENSKWRLKKKMFFKSELDAGKEL